MKKKQNYIGEDGLVGNPSGVDRESEDYKKLQQAITDRYNSLTEEEKLTIKLDKVKYAILEYLENETGNIVPPGIFIKKCLEIVNINQKTFANYINWNTGNLTKLLNGTRKVNAEIAVILEATFPVSAVTWMRIEDKNELFRVKKANAIGYQKYSLKKLRQESKTTY